MDTRTPQSKTMLRAGWIVSGLVILFLLVDAIPKLLRLDFAVDATSDLGYPDSVVVGIGLALLLSTILYAMPRTALLGAVLLTGYFGGATATQVRIEDPWFVFPVVFGALVWAGLYLRHTRLRSMVHAELGASRSTEPSSAKRLHGDPLTT